MRKQQRESAMPHQRRPDMGEREKFNTLAINHYQSSSKPSLRASAEAYGIPWTTLRDRVNGVQDHQESHRGQQLLLVQEEKTIVTWCTRMDNWGFPLKLPFVHEMAECLVKRRNCGRRLGKHWLTRFPNRNPELSSKFTARLERQRAFAENPVVIKDYFSKVHQSLII